jgi:hypothetical protein
MGDAVREAFAATAVAACIGPITGETAASVGFERRCTPERGRLGLLVRRLATELHARHPHLRRADREVNGFCSWRSPSVLGSCSPAGCSASGSGGRPAS